jgi:hypothetical protein
MVCGLCGTNINPGFSTCSACGATYEGHGTCLSNLLVFASIPLLLFGFIMTAICFLTEHPAGGLIGIVLIVVAVGVFWLAAKIKGPRSWVPRRVGGGR